MFGTNPNANIDPMHLARLQGRVATIHMRLTFVGLFVTALAVAAFWVPQRFLPTRRGTHLPTGLKDLTVAESLGMIPVLVTLCVIAALGVYFVLLNSKYSDLKADLRNQEVLTFNVQVLDVKLVSGGVEEEVEVSLGPNPAGLERLNYPMSEFAGVKPGNTIQVSVTKHASYVLSTNVV